MRGLSKADVIQFYETHIHKLSDLRKTLLKLLPDQINMAVSFWYLVKVTLVNDVRILYRSVQWISHVLQVTRNTRPCLSGHPVA